MSYISGSGGGGSTPSTHLYPVTSVNTTPYAASDTDLFLSVDSIGSAITIQLPDAPLIGKYYIIKDAKGLAATNNITITTVGGTVLMDGIVSEVLNTAYESISIIFDGSAYEIF